MGNNGSHVGKIGSSTGNNSAQNMCFRHLDSFEIGTYFSWIFKWTFEVSLDTCSCASYILGLSAYRQSIPGSEKMKF